MLGMLVAVGDRMTERVSVRSHWAGGRVMAVDRRGRRVLRIGQNDLIDVLTVIHRLSPESIRSWRTVLEAIEPADTVCFPSHTMLFSYLRRLCSLVAK